MLNNEKNLLNVDVKNAELYVESTNNSVKLLPETSKSVTFDALIEKCGDFGCFQFMHFFCINLLAVSAATIGYYYVFAAADIDHRCRLPPSEWTHDNQYNPGNTTYQALIDLYIPKTKDGKKWESCLIYQKGDLDKMLVKCPNGWVYDQSIFGRTFTEEANFVCGDKSKRSWLATMMQCGGLSVLFIGSLADRFGRKRLVTIVTISLFIVCIITQTMMQWLPMSINIKFAILLLNQYASGLSGAVHNLIFVLMLELTSRTHRSLSGQLSLVFFTTGEGAVTLFAYLARDWQILKWINTAFIGLIIPYLYFMPESPLYLFAKRDYARFETLLRRIATTNKRRETDWYPVYQELVRNQSIALSNEKELTFIQKLLQLLSQPSIISKLLITALLGFTIMMLYIKISYGLAAMSISPYLGMLIGAALEAAGSITGAFLASTRLGRKGSLVLILIGTIICVLAIPIISNLSPTATVLIALFGKFNISSALAVSWIFIPELFPTAIRNGANGLVIAFSRTGAILSPIIDTSISENYLPYTFYASASLAFIVILLTLFLPETKFKSMADEDN